MPSLNDRRRALRMPVRHLAKSAGLDEDNVHRVLRARTDPRQSTVAALDAALAQEEGRLSAYLAALPGNASRAGDPS